MADEIRIRGLEVWANHGVYEEEARLGQRFVVDMTLRLDTRRAGLTDELELSLIHIYYDLYKRESIGYNSRANFLESG